LTAYGVWVSEIMLQQTRVEAVIPYYLKWMKRFPTIQSLALASEDDVNSHWAGLGFYRRARMLHQGAKRIMNDYNGEMPSTVDGLLCIEGIGPYTASAVASIAFNVKVPVVDGNVCRVLSRLKGIANNIKAPVVKDNVGWKLAEQLMAAVDNKSVRAGEVNQALMELGATYCAPNGSGIDERDPLVGYYLSTKIALEMGDLVISDASFLNKNATASLQDALARVGKSHHCKVCGEGEISNVFIEMMEDMKELSRHKPKDTLDTKSKKIYETYGPLGHKYLPTVPPKKKKREEIVAVAVIHARSTQHGQRHWLMIKRPKKGLLANQWEFPSCSVVIAPTKAAKQSKGNESKQLSAKFSSKERRLALDKFLIDQFVDTKFLPLDTKISECKRKTVTSSPLVHVFSHVVHHMWVEVGDVTDLIDLKAGIEMQWTSKDGRELRWLSEEDMKDVGITSGVKKILAAVHSTNTSRKRKL